MFLGTHQRSVFPVLRHQRWMTPLLDDFFPVNYGDTIRIGGLAPLTGDVAVYGVAAQRGIDLYIEQLNANGGLLGKQVQEKV